MPERGIERTPEQNRDELGGCAGIVLLCVFCPVVLIALPWLLFTAVCWFLL